MSESSNLARSHRISANRRDLLKSAGVAAGVSGLAIAAGGASSLLSPASVSAQTPVATGTLVEGFVGDIGLLAPIVDANRQTLLVFDTLVSTNATTLESEPNLAASWTISDDGLTYAFKLATGVTFHDGQPFSSDDVKFTLDLLLNPATASGYTSLFSDRVAKVENPDPATVVVTLTAPSPTFLGDLSAYSIAILPKHLLADVKPEAFAASDFATKSPVGTGPFKLKEFRPGEALILDPNPAYHRGAPKLAGYALKILGDQTVAYQQLKTGEVDVTAVAPDFYQDATSQTAFAPVVIDTFALNFLAFNQDAKGPAGLKELPVRQALFYAIDRQLIIDSVYSGLGKVAIGTEPPAVTWAYLPDQITEKYAYDPEKAKSLLDGAGWVVGSDGVRAKNGERLSFKALGTTAKTAEGTVLALQEFFSAVGVELTPALEADQFWNKLLAKDFDVAFVNFTFAPDPDQSLAWASTSTYNAWSYNSPQVDDLLKQGIQTVDQKDRAAIYVKIQNILLADLPALVLSFDQRVTGVNKRVANYVPSAVGYYWAIAYDAPTWDVSGS